MGTSILQGANNALLVTPQHHRLVADIDAQGLFISHFLGSGHCPPDILLSRNGHALPLLTRSEEHTSELQSLMRTSYAVFCFTKKIPAGLITQPPKPYHKI